MATTKSLKPVVLLIRNAAKHDFGGAETYTVSLGIILAKNGFHPIVVSRSQKLLAFATSHAIPTRKGWWWSQQNWSGIRVLLTPIYIAWQLLLTLWYIRLIIMTKASVLHIQSKDDFIAATLAGQIMRRRVIWTDHMDLRYIFQNIKRPLRNPIGKLVFWSAHLAHKLILISVNEMKLVTAHFKNKDDLKSIIILIRNGVYDRRADVPQHTHTVFSFCIASRLVVNKGVGEAIEAYISLREDGVFTRPTQLDIYGDGQDRKQFESMAAYYDDIVFHGHVADAAAAIANSNVFMLPSYQEGLSITLLEATMLGKAIIASDVDSNPEVIDSGNTGLLVPARDSISLAISMHHIYSNPELKHKLERGARINYEQHFDLEKIVKDIIIPLYK